LLALGTTESLLFDFFVGIERSSEWSNGFFQKLEAGGDSCLRTGCPAGYGTGSADEKSLADGNAESKRRLIFH
jgi:hypothetical protein